MLHGRTPTNIGLLNTPKRPLPPLSYVNYYFDFEPAQNRAQQQQQATKLTNRTSAALPKYGPAPLQKLASLDWDQEIDALRSNNQQRAIVYQQDVEFYSIAFDLTLETVK